MAKRGRPPMAEEALMNPITVRFPPRVMKKIEEIVAERRQTDGLDKGQLIRELVWRGILDYEAERKK